MNKVYFMNKFILFFIISFNNKLFLIFRVFKNNDYKIFKEYLFIFNIRRKDKKYNIKSI